MTPHRRPAKAPTGDLYQVHDYDCHTLGDCSEIRLNNGAIIGTCLLPAPLAATARAAARRTALIRDGRSALGALDTTPWIASPEQGAEFHGVYAGSVWGPRIAGLIRSPRVAAFIADAPLLVQRFTAELELLSTSRGTGR